jgi:hypothetical protein
LEALLAGFEKFAQKFGELYDEDKPVYLFSLKVDSIEPQRDDIDPIRLKRGKAKIIVKERSKVSSLIATVEFRGRTLILSRREGSCNVEDVAKRLSLEYGKKYPKESLKPDRVLEGGRVHHYSVSDPEHFLGLLHLIQRVNGLDIYSQQGEHMIQKMAEWLRTRREGKPSSKVGLS